MRQLKTGRGAIQQACWCGAVLAFGGLLALPTFAQQQSGSNDSGAQSSSTKDKQAPPSHKNATQENPFPESVSKHAAQQKDQTQDSSDAPQAAQQPAPATQKPGTAAEENPFPEDVSKSAAAAAAKDSGGSSSSSSSNSNPDADLPPEHPGGRGSNDGDIQTLTPVGQVKEDVRVGRFYLGNGNYKGAYSRFSEAARLDPANVDAIYGVAAAADGLHRAEEALANYKLYLAIAPEGKEAKSARKAIRALSK